MRFTDQLEAAASPDVPADDPTSDKALDAALRQFELFGIARSTMEDIARRAKVARVTLYRRFPGKNALVQAVMLRELRRFLRELDAAVAPHPDPQERVAVGFSYVLRAIGDHRLLQRMLESEPEAVIGYLTMGGSGFITAARTHLVALLLAVDDETRPQEELEVVADVVVRMLASFIVTPPELLDTDDPQATRRFALRYLAPMLLHPGAPAPPAD